MAVQGVEDTTPSTVRTLAESLWFPLFFVCGFLFCYLLPFHAPSPHNVEVAVSGPAAASRIQAALDKARPGAFDIQPAASGSAARQAVLARDVSAAFDATPGHPVLYVAKADGYLLETVLTQAFTPLAAQSGGTLTVTDTAPTASGDTMGTGMFYLVLAWNIPSYFVVMMLLRAVTLTRRAKVLTLVGFGALISVIGFYGALAMHVVPNQPITMLFAFLLTQGVSLTSFGLVPIAKQFFPGVAMGLFVMLGMPSSGGAIPVQLVPGFFRALHPFLPMGNLIELLRGLFYFDGVGITRPILVLCAWILVGALLVGGHSLLQRRKIAKGEQAVAEPPVEDPVIEMPRPTALPAHDRHFAGPEPMVVGTVRTREGDAVRGAVVTITDGRGHQLVRTMAGDDGSYAVTGLPEQFVDLVVSAPGWHATVRRVLVREGSMRREDFELATRRHTVAAASDA